MTTNQNVVLRFAMIMVFALAATVAVHGQIYTVLDNLGSTNTDPLQPAWMGIIAQGRDGNLYSTTQAGERSRTVTNTEPFSASLLLEP